MSCDLPVYRRVYNYFKSVYLRLFLTFRNSRKISFTVKDDATIDARLCVYTCARVFRDKCSGIGYI